MATTLTTPRFRQGQIACFIGGKGIIRNCQPDSGSWSYLVEMEMGPEPKTGRIGHETTVRLFETDLTLFKQT